MDRPEFIALLTRIVRDGLITERRAAELLLAFDNGTLQPEDLPQEQEDSDLVPILLFATASLIVLLRSLGYSTELPLVITTSAQRSLREALRLEFQQQSRVLARLLQQSGDVNAWHRGMADLIKRNVVENAMVGAGRILTAEELASLESAIAEQMAFLGRFADRVAFKKMLGTPMSEAAIAARAEMYGRLGITSNAFFEEMSGNYGFGWVAEYIAVDDGGTCSACHGAQGMYRVTEGPMPGELCYGGMRCRCHRDIRYDPAAYVRLTGEVAA